MFSQVLEIFNGAAAVVIPLNVAPLMLGDVAKTGEPDPVTELPNPVATPVPRPEIPVEIGSPVAFVNTSELGVPKAVPLGRVTVPVNVGDEIGA